jgi:methyl-accepting chemotaxis protein
MNAGQLAALIAAGFFAVGVCAAVYVLLRLARLITLATAVLTGYQDATDNLMRRAQAAVDRADEQLARTHALSESVEAVSGSLSDLSEQVAAVAGSARLIANGVGTPVLRIAATGYGIRRALAIRRAGRLTQLPSRDRGHP